MDGSAVGFVGLGNIGARMAGNLLDWPGGLWLYDIDSAATAALEQRGAQVAASPRQVAEQARCVCVMVRDDAQVREVLTGDSGLLAGSSPGTVIAVHSTVHPDTLTELAPVADKRGVHLLDAPVSGGPSGAEQGRLAIMVGGDDTAFALARPLLERMGGLVVHVGAVGAGTATKIARNLVTFAGFVAAREALVLAERAGIDRETLGNVVRYTDALTGGPGAIMWRTDTHPLAPGDPWWDIFGHTRALGEKDLALAVQLADGLGVDLPLTRLALERFAASLGFDAEVAD